MGSLNQEEEKSIKVCADWAEWNPVNSTDNAARALAAAERYLGVSQVFPFFNFEYFKFKNPFRIINSQKIFTEIGTGKTFKKRRKIYDFKEN